MTTFSRRVSPTEWSYLGGFAVTPPFAVTIIVEGEGELDPAALTRAVERASAACPGARLVRRGRRWVDSGRTPPVRVNTGSAADAVAGAAAGSSADPFGGRIPVPALHPDDGPNCAVDLVPGAVVFHAFHGVMDARGLLTWIADVFRALRGEEPLGAAGTDTDDELAERLGAPGRRPRLTARWPSPLRDPAATVMPADHVIQSRTVAGNHRALVAKIAAALSADAPRRFMVPVDVRRHDPSIAATGNLSLPIFLDTAAGDSWPGLHDQLVTALRANREVTIGATEKIAYRLPAAALGPLVRTGSRLAGQRGKYLCSAIISHFGRFDVADYSAPGFAATTVRPVPLQAPFVPVSVVATQVTGRTELAVSCQAGGTMPDQATALLAAIAAALDPAVFDARPRIGGHRAVS